MSSYLSFYLVPKKYKKTYKFNKDNGHTETEVELSKGEPLLFMSYSRSSEVYQAYDDALDIVFCGMNETQYTELTYEKAKHVIQIFEENIRRTEARLKTDYKMLKEGGYSSELWEEIHSFEDYVSEQKSTLVELKSIANMVYDVYEDYNDFEKVLINID